MPKRIGNIFEEKLKFDKMLRAYKRASKEKHENKEVVLFKMNLATNITNMLLDIYKDRYVIGSYRKFKIYEPKERIIWALPFRDRVMHQWYVEEFIKPIFLPKFISDTYACIEGRGVHKAIIQLLNYMKKMYNKNKDYYILKCDIRKFFYSIDKSILYNILSRYIKDKKLLNFTKNIIYQRTTSKNGIPIGNYTSQFFANIYLNQLDHYVKEKLKVKYYIRYMDDFVLLLNNKEECKDVKNKLEHYLKENLELELNEKTNYFKNTQGVKFCGYKIKDNHIKILKGNKKKIYRKIKKWNQKFKNKDFNITKVSASLNAWIGHASHASSRKLIDNVIDKCEWIYREKKEQTLDGEEKCKNKS